MRQPLLPFCIIGFTLASCHAPDEPVQDLAEVIPGTAMPVRLAPDSTWIPLSDFCPEHLPDEVYWIPAWGQGIQQAVQVRDAQSGVWIQGQPAQGFGALELRLNGRAAHVPVLSSTQQSFTYTMPSDYQEHTDVRIMGAFNGWSRTSHPLALDRNGQWSIELLLPEGQHPYQLVVDGQEMPDPVNPHKVDNGFGGFNSILTMEGNGENIELAAIGFGGNQVHDVRLLGTPGARVWGWWENQLYATTTLGEDGTVIS